MCIGNTKFCVLEFTIYFSLSVLQYNIKNILPKSAKK